MRGAVLRWDSRCNDLDGDGCPCILAETCDCPECSMLQGKELCDCRWRGLCVLLKRYWAEPYVAQLGEVDRGEPELLRAIYVAPQVLKAVFAVPDGFLVELNRPGSCAGVVFGDGVKEGSAVGPVMDVLENIGVVSVVLQVDGPLARCMQRSDGWLRMARSLPGVIWGGELLERLRAGRALLVAAGLGQAATVLAARVLRDNDNKTWAVLVDAGGGRLFAEDRLQRLGVRVLAGPHMEKAVVAALEEIRADGPVGLLFSAGPRSQHRELARLLRRLGGNPVLVTWNLERVVRDVTSRA